MGWGFRATCPDCYYEWEGIETNARLGRWSPLEFGAIDDGFRAWFCPRCYFRLRIPRVIERNAWRKWYAAFLDGPGAGSDFLRDVAARVDSILARGRFYTPIPVDLEPVDCPGCRQPFEESDPAVPDRLVCPQCRGRGAVLDGFESHCQVLRDDHGFS